MSQTIKAIDLASVHRITSGQVVIDLQTAVKELLENSIDAGATNVEVRFKNHGLTSVEVVDNGSGISEDNYDSIALKHHTSKLETYDDLLKVTSFGFRGEALSSLCALSQSVIVCTSTSQTTPLGVILTMDGTGKVKEKGTVARTQGTSVTVHNLFKPLPVRRKEFERNAKREFGKALSLLTAYALGPCTITPGVRLTVTNQPEKGPKSFQIRTLGSTSCRESVTALWGTKTLENIVDMKLTFSVDKEKSSLQRLQSQGIEPIQVEVRGLISKFAFGCGRTGTDRQFFYVNGRPCNMNKVQKAFNEVYRSFNTNQSPFIVADFIIPTDCYDVNVSPDKRTILLHHEGNLITALKASLETCFSSSRSTYDLGGTQSKLNISNQSLLSKTTPSFSITRTTPPVMPRSHAETEIDEIDNRVSSGTQPVSPETSNTTEAPKTTVSPLRLPSSTAQNKSILRNTELNVSDAAETMDIDGSNNLFDEEDSVVFDSSQTSWGKQLGITRRSSSPPSNPLFLPDEDLLDHGLPEDGLEQPPPHKKRKSNAGVVLSNQESSMKTIEEIDVGSGPSKGTPSLGSSSLSAFQSKDYASVLATKSSSNSKRTIREKLASLARSGSRLSSQTKITSFGVSSRQKEQEDNSEDDDEEVMKPNSDGPRDELVEAPEDNSDDEIRRAIEAPDLVVEANLKQSSIESTGITVDLALDDEDILDSTSVLSQVQATSSMAPHTVSEKDMVAHPEIIKTDKDGRNICITFDLDRIKGVWSRKMPGHDRANISDTENGQESTTQSVPVDAGISNIKDDAKAAGALARVIEKKDFEKMAVVGQFNLGFIVIRRQKMDSSTNDMASSSKNDVLDDLFIVDQHAADEKYNFETLQSTTKIESQKLFRPRPLELTASDEMVAIENLVILRQNGFELEVNDDNPFGQGSKLKLLAQPVSKSTVFDVKDLEELIHLLHDRPGTEMVRCSKARAMFASRACRKSVMIGMPLNTHQMTTVVRHMGMIDQPWNCPHGRPTMRHLLDIRNIVSKSKDRIDWSSIC